ncbi:hypothetical protein CHARACLAT_011453 [Characodon lateralis]|uniref:Uncharacterized protein n=1 Tax=Characodon lateralis TaxID=208331 RepID=A0ABU7D6C1_9TELE|nr:hypothetical protein [Characodon lateralis]
MYVCVHLEHQNVSRRFFPSLLYPVPLAGEQLHTMMLPPPCLAVCIVLRALKAAPLFLQTSFLSLCPSSSVFVSSDHRNVLLKTSGLSMWAAAGYRWWGGASVLGDAKLVSL